MSKALRGNKYCLGRPCSDETRAKLSVSHTGVPLSPAHRAAMSDSHFLFLNEGYAYAKFLGSWELAHRLAYVYYHGPIPEGRIVHHGNEDKLDNRKDNLESVTPGEHNRIHKLGRPRRG
ncbi:hypothetical protein LCGC14_2167940 [marine sediment metagenome]|uniref:Nuclease associated modular domain-containing protein n=1 Tax=marine sediment metagenome TaxID=412755 RepID=A0A0F9GLV0_9ZZZZ